MSIFVCNQCGGPLIKKGRPKGIQQYYCKVCQVKTLHPKEIEDMEDPEIHKTLHAAQSEYEDCRDMQPENHYEVVEVNEDGVEI